MGTVCLARMGWRKICITRYVAVTASVDPILVLFCVSRPDHCQWCGDLEVCSRSVSSIMTDHLLSMSFILNIIRFCVQVVHKCWLIEPNDRPTFSDIVEVMQLPFLRSFKLAYLFR